MSIEHHPPSDLLTAFAAGTLDLGQHIAVATHLAACPECRALTKLVEQAGGIVLENQTPAAMGAGALASVESRLNDPIGRRGANIVSSVPASEVPGLPRFVRRYRFGTWKWVAPSVRLRRIELPCRSDTRVFLLKSGPGTRMMEHSHTQLELTCVLSGAFTEAGSYYGPGDFGFGDEAVDHRPTVEPGEDCICLVAMKGELHLKGLTGRIVQPFIRL